MNQIKKITGFLLLIGLALNLVACGEMLQKIKPTPTPTPIPIEIQAAIILATASPVNNWQTNWLEGIPCRPPCWEGITPGVTTFTQTTQILQKKNFVINLEVDPTRSRFMADTYTNWSWISSIGLEPNGRNNNSSVHTNEGSDKIAYIKVLLNTTIAEVIKYYGEPEFINVDVYKGVDYVDKNIRFVYLKHGFMVVASNTGLLHELLADSQINEIIFFVPNLEGLEKIISKDDLTVWQGFESFRFYCRAVRTNYCD